MSYATVADYIAFFGEQEAIELTNLDAPEAVTVDEELLLEHLEAASAQVDGNLATRYSLPLEPPYPVALKQMTLSIARKTLDRYHCREQVQTDYETVIDRLKRIARGQEVLLDSEGALLSGAPDSQRETGEVGFSAGQRTFTRENLSRFGRNWY